MRIKFIILLFFSVFLLSCDAAIQGYPSITSNLKVNEEYLILLGTRYEKIQVIEIGRGGFIKARFTTSAGSSAVVDIHDPEHNRAWWLNLNNLTAIEAK